MEERSSGVPKEKRRKGKRSRTLAREKKNGLVTGTSWPDGQVSGRNVVRSRATKTMH